MVSSVFLRVIDEMALIYPTLAAIILSESMEVSDEHLAAALGVSLDPTDPQGFPYFYLRAVVLFNQTASLMGLEQPYLRMPPILGMFDRARPRRRRWPYP